MNNIINAIKLDSQRLIIVVSAVFLVLPNLSFGVSDLQFIFVATIPILTYIVWRLRGDKFTYHLHISDLSWIIFVGIGFLSYIWAIDGALVWYQSFGWLAYFILMITCRTIFTKAINLDLFSFSLCGIFLILLAVQIGIFSLYGTENIKIWHDVFERNGNYTSCLLAILYPFFLFQKSSTLFLRVLKLICTLLMFLTLYFTTSKGIFLSLPFIVLLWIEFEYPEYKRIARRALYGGLAICIFGFILLSTTSTLDEFYGIGLSTRGYMLKASYLIFLEKPFLGIGLGNWFLKAYSYGVDEIRYFGNSYYWIRYHSHNLFGRLLAEVGGIGLISFLTLFIYIIRSRLAQILLLNRWEYASLSSLVLYLLLSCFYNAPSFLQYKFSGVQLIAFASMGILTTRFSGVKNTFVVRIILLSSLFSIGWFTYSAYINNVYHHAQTAIRDGDLGQGLSLLNSIYDPQLNTAHSYKDLIPFKMAQLANEIGEVDKAIIYYEESIMKAPYNGELLYEYGKFLLDHDADLIKAEELLIRAESQQANRHAVNYCLAELYVQKKEWNRARSYINKLENSSYEHKGGKLLEVVQLNELKE